MKLLLTSAGVKNASIQAALVALLEKPIAESSVLCIPTGAYGHPMVGPAGPYRFVTGQSDQPMTGLGWKSIGMLDGGDALCLCHWMRESGLADLLPSLNETVYVGFSAGSMVLTPRIGAVIAVSSQIA